ncbi:MAG: hypothetical protein JW965_02860 [Bacteroidales bacterium]|nr:hypothetical protein [Bacteroidales bacterium]
MKRLAIIISIIIIVILLFIIGRHVPFGADNSVFYVENTERINRILISDENKSVSLTLNTDGWYVNDEYRARSQAIDFLISILGDIRIKSPVTDKTYNDLLQNNSTREIEVQVFNSRKIIQSFYIYLNNEVDYPGIMQKRKKTKPFIVHLPGYDTDPCSHFVPDSRYWMPNMVFELNPGRISEIHFRYFNMPDSSFSIINNGAAMAFISKDYNNERIDSVAAGRYLSYFTWVPFETWVYDISTAEKDSITENNPYFSLEVITDDPDTLKLLTWKRMIMKGGRMVEDTDRLLGSLNGGEDLFVIRYYDLDPLIKEPSYFIID